MKCEVSLHAFTMRSSCKHDYTGITAKKDPYSSAINVQLVCLNLLLSNLTKDLKIYNKYYFKNDVTQLVFFTVINIIFLISVHNNGLFY